MKHKVFCHECRKIIKFEVAGDLSQYTDTTFSCPCKEETIVPKPINDNTVNFGLFCIASKEAPSDTARWLRLYG